MRLLARPEQPPANQSRWRLPRFGRQRGRLRSASLLVGVVLLVAALALGRGLPALAPGSGSSPQQAAGAEAPGRPPEAATGEVPALLDELSELLRPLHQQVEAGQLVPQFGDRAQGVVSALAARVPATALEDATTMQIERLADSHLEVLFLRQLATLRRQLVGKYGAANKPFEAIAQADANFIVEAKALVRPGSAWSYEQERYLLRAILEGAFRREAALTEEKARSAQVQQTTVELINKMQSKVETLQQKVQNLRAGSPWVLSASYRIPKTPFNVIGRYQQGHGSVELSLSPDKDPANAENGFVQGLAGPANIGLSVNLGA